MKSMLIGNKKRPYPQFYGDDRNITSIFLREMGDIPLLGPEKEKEKFSQVRKLRSEIYKIFRELAFIRREFGPSRKFIYKGSRMVAIEEVLLHLRAVASDFGETKDSKLPQKSIHEDLPAELAQKLESISAQIARDLLQKSYEAEFALHQLKKEIVGANLRLVVTVAKKFQGNRMEISDLINEGSIGVMKAADFFDPDRGGKFSTYAIWWIRQTVSRAVLDQGRTVRLPLHVDENLSKIKKAISNLAHRLNRRPTVQEIGEHLGWPEKRVVGCLGIIRRRFVALEQNIGDSDLTVGDFIEDGDAASIIDLMAKEENRLSVRQEVEELDNKERLVIKGRFVEEKTLREVGEELGLSRERIRQIQTKGLRKLRGRLLRRHLTSIT